MLTVATAGTAAPEGLADGGVQAGATWYALHARSQCEQLVHDQLEPKGFRLFFPTINVWSRRAGVRHLIRRPLFPGYLFLRTVMDKTGYVEIQKVRGLVRVLGDAWNRLAVVPDEEIDAVAALLHSSLPFLPYPYLREGQRVRITGGPLAGVEGVLLHVKANKGLLVVSLNLLQRSLGVEVDCTLVSPA